MKELFTAFGNYNRNVNAHIFETLLRLSEAELSHTIRAHYPSIVDTVVHVMKSDARWLERLSRYSDAGDTMPGLRDGLPEPPIEYHAFYKNLETYARLRAELDRYIVAAIHAIPEGEFLLPFEMQFGPGTIREELWKLLFQWFNHQTHHRGQISVQLDAVGVENDYSLVLNKLDLKQT